MLISCCQPRGLWEASLIYNKSLLLLQPPPQSHQRGRTASAHLAHWYPMISGQCSPCQLDHRDGYSSPLSHNVVLVHQLGVLCVDFLPETNRTCGSHTVHMTDQFKLAVIFQKQSFFVCSLVDVDSKKPPFESVKRQNKNIEIIYVKIGINNQSWISQVYFNIVSIPTSEDVR